MDIPHSACLRLEISKPPWSKAGRIEKIKIAHEYKNEQPEGMIL
jgi:hypothetical protein